MARSFFRQQMLNFQCSDMVAPTEQHGGPVDITPSTRSAGKSGVVRPVHMY